jgi:hypothetical protein
MDHRGSFLPSPAVLERRMLVTVALANKMARIVWALRAHGGSYRVPRAPAAAT